MKYSQLFSARCGGAPLINVTLGPGSQSDQARGGLYYFTTFFLFYFCFDAIQLTMAMLKIDETLILAVSNYEELYNSKSKYYANTNRRNIAWTSVSNQVHLSGE